MAYGGINVPGVSRPELDSALEALKALLTAGQGIEIVQGANGKKIVQVSKDIRYKAKSAGTMVVGLDTSGFSNVGAVEFTQTDEGDSVVLIGSRTNSNRTDTANVAAGIEMGTSSQGLLNAINFISDGKLRGWIDPRGFTILAHGMEPLIDYNDSSKNLVIGCLDGNELSIVTGMDGSTGDAGQVLTAMGDGTCEWQRLPMSEYVIAQGTSDIWSWRKWASGAAECWGTVVCENVSCMTAWGSMYETSDGFGNVAYPFEFAERPNQQLSVSCTTGGTVFLEAPHGHNNSNSTTRTGVWYFCRPNQSSDGQTVYVDIYVRGKCK